MKATAPCHLAVLVVMLLLMAWPAAAQQPVDPEQDSFAQGAAVLGANAMIGGLTGGLRAWIEGRPVGPAFLQGAAGGSLVFVGKRIAVERGDLAPVTGRMVASLGTSVIAHATTPAWLDTLHIAAGPLRFRFGSATWKPDVSVALTDVIAIGMVAAAGDTRLDWSRTLSTLTPVFITRRTTIEEDGRRIFGFTAAGVIAMDGTRTDADVDAVFRHELVHVVQHDFMTAGWGRPIENWARHAAPGAAVVPSWLSFDVVPHALWWLTDAVADGNGVLRRLMQAEAEWFERR